MHEITKEEYNAMKDRLEKAEDFEKTLNEMIRKTIKDHKRILFNGNGYDDSWIVEAEKRGLCNYKTTVDCMPRLLDEKNVKMLTSHGVFTETELKSRVEIMLENYCKTVTIEANTMADMARRQILPAIVEYMKEVTKEANGKLAFAPAASTVYEKKVVERLSSCAEDVLAKTEELESLVATLKGYTDVEEEGCAIRDSVLPKMEELRAVADEAERITAGKCWPFPTYGELLFGVR